LAETRQRKWLKLLYNAGAFQQQNCLLLSAAASGYGFQLRLPAAIFLLDAWKTPIGA